ncbi:DUF928 domain-containing protein [Kovacikia minuta]|uniref:DUF928 domain-containing protein n=1 Tax=Kovacikia minuta TaxID=2931930 RepID=UPI0020C7AB43|nr:DUF928 domain-containing protein [Kovacikia minuta]
MSPLALSTFCTVYSPNGSVAQARSLQFQMPSPPSRGIPPGRTRGGASRGVCPEVQTPLTALTPSTPQITTPEQKGIPTQVWGYTTAAHPTFWFYLPYNKSFAGIAEFVLQDENENNIYRSTIALPAKAGVISVPLPKSAPALEVGKPYRWFLSIYCDSGEDSATRLCGRDNPSGGAGSGDRRPD